MPSPTGRFHVFLDRSFAGALRLRPRAGAAAGASLPGGQARLTTQVIDPDGPSPLLRTGDSKHSMWRTTEWRLLRPVAEALPEPVLDLGCGDGTFGELVRSRIDWGVEGDADAARGCDAAIYGRVAVGDLREALPVPQGEMAAAFSNSTFEHVEPVAPALVAAHDALRPGGTLVLTVPTIGFTQALTAGYGAAFADRMNALLGHRNLWDWARWRKELGPAGFPDIRIRGYLTHEAARWYGSRELAPWQQLSRRAGDWLWNHDRERVRTLVERSLAATAEEETACALIEAGRD